VAQFYETTTAQDIDCDGIYTHVLLTAANWYLGKNGHFEQNAAILNKTQKLTRKVV